MISFLRNYYVEGMSQKNMYSLPCKTAMGLIKKYKNKKKTAMGVEVGSDARYLCRDTQRCVGSPHISPQRVQFSLYMQEGWRKRERILPFSGLSSFVFE